VAAAAAGILIGDGHAGAIYSATGPERLSGAERASLIAEITGQPLAFRVITEEQLRAGLTKAGLPAAAVNIVLSIQASFAAGSFDVVTGDVERLGGRPPKPLRACRGAEISFGLKTAQPGSLTALRAREMSAAIELTPPTREVRQIIVLPRAGRARERREQLFDIEPPADRSIPAVRRVFGAGDISGNPMDII
jgi:hypothetical protein